MIRNITTRPNIRRKPVARPTVSLVAKPIHGSLPVSLARHREIDRRRPVPAPCHLGAPTAPIASESLRRLAEAAVPAFALKKPPQRMRVEHGFSAADFACHDYKLMPRRSFEERCRQAATISVVAGHGQARRRRRLRSMTLVGSGGATIPCRDSRGRGGCGSLGGRSGIHRTRGPAVLQPEHFRCRANPGQASLQPFARQ